MNVHLLKNLFYFYVSVCDFSITWLICPYSSRVSVAFVGTTGVKYRRIDIENSRYLLSLFCCQCYFVYQENYFNLGLLCKIVTFCFSSLYFVFLVSSMSAIIILCSSGRMICQSIFLWPFCKLSCLGSCSVLQLS